jgi:hypothetical protein
LNIKNNNLKNIGTGIMKKKVKSYNESVNESKLNESNGDNSVAVSIEIPIIVKGLNRVDDIKSMVSELAGDYYGLALVNRYLENIFADTLYGMKIEGNHVYFGGFDTENNDMEWITEELEYALSNGKNEGVMYIHTQAMIPLDTDGTYPIYGIVENKNFKKDLIEQIKKSLKRIRKYNLDVLPDFVITIDDSETRF